MADPVRVLVVEDSAAMRTFVGATLESEGFEVILAGSGFEALRLLPRERFDLVVTDINMPDINGLELIRLVREGSRHARVPVLIISTDGAEQDRQRGMSLGATAYLTKPFGPEALLAAARSALTGGATAG